MANHQYSFTQVWGWVYYGWVQRIRDIAPVVNPTPVDFGPPGWWWRWYSYTDWAYNLSAQSVPNSYWIRLWQDGSYSVFKDYISEIGTGAKEDAQNTVRGWLGYIQGAYPTFSSWLGSVSTWVGPLGLWWTNNLTTGVNWVRYKLPEVIRGETATWDDIWEGIKASVRDWVLARYEEAKRWASDSWTWVVNVGATIRGWYDIAHTWLDDFRWNASQRVREWLGSAWTWLVGFWNDPSGTILSILGETWQKLVTFTRDCLVFWYNLWGSYAKTLGDFLADPLGWLYDQVEDEIIRRW